MEEVIIKRKLNSILRTRRELWVYWFVHTGVIQTQRATERHGATCFCNRGCRRLIVQSSGSSLTGVCTFYWGPSTPCPHKLCAEKPDAYVSYNYVKIKKEQLSCVYMHEFHSTDFTTPILTLEDILVYIFLAVFPRVGYMASRKLSSYSTYTVTFLLHVTALKTTFCMWCTPCYNFFHSIAFPSHNVLQTEHTLLKKV